jgi:hypothetical protein
MIVGEDLNLDLRRRLHGTEFIEFTHTEIGLELSYDLAISILHTIQLALTQYFTKTSISLKHASIDVSEILHIL